MADQQTDLLLQALQQLAEAHARNEAGLALLRKFIGGRATADPGAGTTAAASTTPVSTLVHQLEKLNPIKAGLTGPGPLYPPGVNTNPTTTPHTPDCQVSTNAYGVVFQLSHDAAQQVASSIPNVAEMINLAAGTDPMFDTAATVVGAALAVYTQWILSADHGSGVYITSLWVPPGAIVVGPV